MMRLLQRFRWVLYLLFALCIVSQFGLVWGRVPSGSMTPTLPVGSSVLFSRIHGPLRDGEIITFYAPRTSGLHSMLVKRIIGVPGDHIVIRGGRVIRNGIVVPGVPVTYSISAFIVPQGDLFVLGDNRNHSYDSHVWGFLPIRNVIGVLLSAHV